MRRIVGCLLLVLVATSGVPAQAQEPVAAAGSSATELARINATLERIADALTQQTKLDILARRIQLASARLADGEKRLAAVNDERSAREADEQRLRLMREELDVDADEAIDMAPRERKAQLAQADAELARIASRLQDLDGRAAELESRLTRERADLDDWKTYLDRLISAL